MEVLEEGLSIRNVTLEDKGDYQCKAYQISPLVNNMEVQTVYLKVKCK